ncbi:MAG: 2-oxoglutarate dehydrogenase E1 component [Bacteroidales bacterium]|nr:2-oxoglutarate dehydrogenase E1 component [Bacteroidales bacterium]
MAESSFLGHADPGYIEDLYKRYLNDPEQVDKSWQDFFRGFDFAIKHFPDKGIHSEVFDKEFKVINLINGYRRRGHLFTKTNPVRTRRSYSPTLGIENYGLIKEDLDSTFHAGNEIGIGSVTLKEIISHLEQTYCQSIGAEYHFIRRPEKIAWLQQKMESTKNTPHYTSEEKKHFYFHLKMAVGFELFIHKKFTGQKRFSLEGAENLIPALDAAISKGAELGIEEFIIGMSHRGRLNVLGNVLQKPYENIFKEFVADQYEDNISLGDVKYHLGYGNTITTDSGRKVRLNLAPNPSHLEAVAPVIQGISRGKIDHKYNGNYNKLAPVIIHGDAAIAGQGVVYEVIQMSELDGYKTGGTIHFIINNQVGFTTNYLEARSSTYCTDIGKVIKAPIFHVNGDDLEALIFVIHLAMEYRQEFHSDVFIDLLCYRKHGHNEGDEPRFTQPTLYKTIAKHPNPRDIYAKHLIENGIYSAEEIQDINQNFDEILEEKFEISKTIEKVYIKRFLIEDWKGFRYSHDKDFVKSPETSVSVKTLKHLADKINYLPTDKNFFSKTIKLIEDRKNMVKNNLVDWALGELLAYATLLYEGVSIRLSGQDSVRGTFSHRHMAHVIEDTDQKYCSLSGIGHKQNSPYVFNSHLSEYGVLGFEYGYALANPNDLVIWEAQFGDFANVAQVIIDQYISSAEEKWGLMNGLVLFLPHGYEGQGPEHSSARIERFLMLAARNNMQITNCTTPANFFHLLRRQIKRDFRVPLIVFTPKSLLRHRKCVSSINELSHGRFQEVIDDKDTNTNEVRRVVFCSGKIYYDLLEEKEENNANDIALVRIEQLHPFPEKQITEVVKKYKYALLHLWVQEEPENMGAWYYLQNKFKGICELVPVTRIASGSPAVGLAKLHTLGQKEIIRKVFRKCTCERKLKYCGLQCVVGKSREEILKTHNYFEEKNENGGIE